MVFPTFIREIAEQWNSEVFTELEWRELPGRPMYTGESGGYHVMAEGFPYRGYLKPRKSDGRPRAAYEKIVSDLAAKVNILVPPVLLFRHTNALRDEEPNVCISLVIHDVIIGFPDFLDAHLFDDSEMKMLMSRCSGIIAFDTYIGNTDRNNPCNTYFGSDNTHLDEDSFVFLDHSNSMNYEDRWDNGNHRNVFVPEIPQEILDYQSQEIIDLTCTAIESLDEHFIRHIVNRIPDDYLQQSEKEIIITGLLDRRCLVRSRINLGWKGVEMTRGISIYHYAILNYQKSLYDNNDVIPLAVIVFSSFDKKIMVMGLEVDIDGLSPYSMKIIKNVKSNLSKAIFKARNYAIGKENTGNAFFEMLGNTFKWNLFITPYATTEGEDILSVLFKLFAENIISNVQIRIPVQNDDIVQQEEYFKLATQINDMSELQKLLPDLC